MSRAVRELHILGRRQWRMKAHYVLSHRPRCACVSLRKAPTLLYRHTLCQIPRLIHVKSPVDARIIAQQLQRNHRQ